MIDIPQSPHFFENAQEFHDWLVLHGTTTSEIWIGLYKKNSKKKGITYAHALDEALCFGWIDGLVKKYNDMAYMQRFTPRRAKSVWSKINTEHITRLFKEQRMMPQGIRAVEMAKKDGRWDRAYASPKTMDVPTDFLQALKKNVKAFEFFETLNRTNTYAILYRIHTAVRPETRVKRIAESVRKLAQKETYH